MRKFRLSIGNKWRFNLTEENYQEVIANDGLRDQITEWLENMRDRRHFTAQKRDFHLKLVPTEREIELFDLMDKANERETEEDHLTAAERQELVNRFLETYKDVPALLKNFPADKDLDRQFDYILDEF